MTPIAKERAEIEAMYKRLEAMPDTPDISLAMQSLVAACFWLEQSESKVRMSVPL